MKPVTRAGRALLPIALMPLLVALEAVPAGAQTAPVVVSASRPRVEALRGDLGPRVDGRLDEPLWQQARFVREFVQRDPQQGQPATQQTEVAFVYTEEALYVGARMHADSGQVRALVTRRDREETSDQLLVSLDTYHDLRTAYTFAITAAGVRIDYYHSADFEGRREYGYDPVWEAATQVDSTGWSAEIRIPFTQLRFNAADQQVWGVNIARLTPARNEVAYWQLVGRNETGWASRMGELVGIQGIRPSRRVELFPYAASEARVFSQTDAANPFSEKREAALRFGGDVKMGLGPSLTLDATFNPDFGQVEADPAEVNLSAFETTFAERRPFFIEGTQILGGRGEFYSRRIGAPPPIRPPSNFSESRANSTILGAAKVTGRLASGLTLGLLSAVTDREQVRTYDVTSNAFSDYEVSPRTGWGVIALQQEFGQAAGTSAVANLMLTGVERALPDTGLLTNVLSRRAYTGLADYRIRWRGGQYDASAYIGYSYIEGDTAAILQQQRSSRRYFQRPDYEKPRLDPSRTSLFGWKAGLNHSKLSGQHWLWDIDLYAESPGLELNDIGRIGNGDDRGVSAGVRYRETTPGQVLRNYELGVNATDEFNYENVRTFTIVSAYMGTQLRNYWQVNVDAAYFPRWQSDNLTRGGPLMESPTNWSGGGSLSSRPGARTRWRVGFSASRDELGGWGLGPNAGLSFRPGSQWEVSIDPRFSKGEASRQYIATLTDGSAATYGGRYNLLATRSHRSSGAHPRELRNHAGSHPGNVRRAVRLEWTVLRLRRAESSAQP